jgi:hypothetical protein
MSVLRVRCMYGMVTQTHRPSTLWPAVIFVCFRVFKLIIHNFMSIVCIMFKWDSSKVHVPFPYDGTKTLI